MHSYGKHLERGRSVKTCFGLHNFEIILFHTNDYQDDLLLQIRERKKLKNEKY